MTEGQSISIAPTITSLYSVSGTKTNLCSSDESNAIINIVVENCDQPCSNPGIPNLVNPNIYSTLIPSFAWTQGSPSGSSFDISIYDTSMSVLIYQADCIDGFLHTLNPSNYVGEMQLGDGMTYQLVIRANNTQDEVCNACESAYSPPSGIRNRSRILTNVYNSE